MALTATIGQPCVVQTLFVDGNNQPVNVDNPRCTVFYLDVDGNKQLVVDDQPMAGVGAETGRFRYIFAVPGNLIAGDSLYAEMTATDEALVGRYFAEQQLTAIVQSTATGTMRVQFVRGG